MNCCTLSLERWVSNPVKEVGNAAVGIGNLAYQLTYKLAELEAAADLVSEGKMADAEKIYGRINSEIDAIYKHISAMSGPEILKASTELLTDGFMFATAFKAGTHLLRNARLSNICTDEYLTTLCKEVGCEVPKNAKSMLEIIDKTKLQAKVAGTPKGISQVKSEIVAPLEHKAVFSKNKSQLRHMLCEREGHLVNTLANRKLILKTVTPKNFLLIDKYGKQWYHKILENGSQIWVETRNGIIRNCGKNIKPRIANPETGLARFIPKQKGITSESYK